MSKIEVKFWDKKHKEYFSDEVMIAFNLTVGVELDVWVYGKVIKEIEPHFYKGGERIA